MQYLILMQGVPGSGKTTEAKKLSEEYNALVYSTDDFFVVDGVYKFDWTLLAENHAKNLDRTIEALKNGHSVIVDNTNIYRWQVKPYVKVAVDLGIEVKFVRVTGQYSNNHEVPPERVQAMRQSMEFLSIESVLGSRTPGRINEKETC